MSLGDAHSDAVRKALAQRTGRDLDSGSDDIFRMSQAFNAAGETA